MSLWLMDDEQKEREREGYAIVAIELVFAVCSRRRRLMLSFAYLFLLLPSNVLCCDRSSFSSFSSLVQIGRSFFMMMMYRTGHFYYYLTVILFHAFSFAPLSYCTAKKSAGVRCNQRWKKKVISWKIR